MALGLCAGGGDWTGTAHHREARSRCGRSRPGEPRARVGQGAMALQRRLSRPARLVPAWRRRGATDDEVVRVRCANPPSHRRGKMGYGSHAPEAGGPCRIRQAITNGKLRKAVETVRSRRHCDHDMPKNTTLRRRADRDGPVETARQEAWQTESGAEQCSRCSSPTTNPTTSGTCSPHGFPTSISRMRRPRKASPRRSRDTTPRSSSRSSIRDFRAPCMRRFPRTPRCAGFMWAARGSIISSPGMPGGSP